MYLILSFIAAHPFFMPVHLTTSLKEIAMGWVHSACLKQIDKD